MSTRLQRKLWTAVRVCLLTCTKIVPLHKCNLEASTGSVYSDARARSTPSNDQQVKVPLVLNYLALFR